MAKLEKGQKMFDFTFDSPWEESLSFQTQAAAGGKKYTILKFLRYYGCTACQVDVADLEANYSKLSDADAQVFVVFQSARETLRDEYGDRRPPFTYICDPEMSLYKKLEIGDGKNIPFPGMIKKLTNMKKKIEELGLEHGKYEGNEQQAPATFILDKDMNVLYSHYGINALDTMDVDETLAELKKL